MTRNPLTLARWYRRSRAAAAYARRRGAPGAELDRFGRGVGWRLLARGNGLGAAFLVSPVSIVRYFELPFVISAAPASPATWLDVSSPSLLVAWVASRVEPGRLVALNPDAADLGVTQEVVDALGVRSRVDLRLAGAESLERCERDFDCVTAVSVVEHVAGDLGDSEAMKRMYRALAPGGRMIVTVPVDREFRLEHREGDPYGTQGAPGPEGYFFQRVYDRRAVVERLVEPLGATAAMTWFGETSPGRFAAYERAWRERGQEATVEDAREIADHYAPYDSWEEMPGAGVCGLVLEKE